MNDRIFAPKVVLCALIVLGVGSMVLLSETIAAVNISSDNMLADFYWEGSPVDFPDGWEELIGGELVGDIVFFEHDASEDHWTIRLVNDTENERYGVASPRFPVEAVGTEYIGLAEAKATGGRARMFLEFLTEDMRRIVAKEGRTSENEWTSVASVAAAPEGAAWVRLFLYSDRNHRGEIAFRNLQLMKY